MLLRARVILPVCQPPIENGAVRVTGHRIAAVGRASDVQAGAGEETVDPGDVILLPGLINAHCHLDYTHMAGMLPPQKRFTDWVKLITSTKAGWSYTEFAASWVDGAGMLLRTGTTTVADIEAVPELLPDVWASTPLRVFSFLEMTGVKSRRDPRAILREAEEKIESLPAGRNTVGLSPHAPYSTAPELLRMSAETARQRGWRITTHVAESTLEFEMFAHARGEMFDWLRRNERDMSDCGQGTPVQHLERCGLLGEYLLAVHANCLGPDDAALLGRRKVSVVHCPRSHDYFGHPPFPLRDLLNSGANICLGTDSLASARKQRNEPSELNMFAEMHALARNAPALSPETIVRMATVNGATALGMGGQLGVLAEGSIADLIAIPFNGVAAEANDAVIHHKGNVAASMIDGQWALAPTMSRRE